MLAADIEEWLRKGSEAGVNGEANPIFLRGKPEQCEIKHGKKCKIITSSEDMLAADIEEWLREGSEAGVNGEANPIFLFVNNKCV